MYAFMGTVIDIIEITSTAGVIICSIGVMLISLRHAAAVKAKIDFLEQREISLTKQIAVLAKQLDGVETVKQSQSQPRQIFSQCCN
jgi:Tfp pilus assembly protein PilN